MVKRADVEIANFSQLSNASILASRMARFCCNVAQSSEREIQRPTDGTNVDGLKAVQKDMSDYKTILTAAVAEQISGEDDLNGAWEYIERWFVDDLELRDLWKDVPRATSSA